MSSRDWLFRIQDILKSIQKIDKFLEGIALEDFMKNELIVDAVIRNFEIIGEASNHIPKELQNSLPEIPWQEMNGMRNVLIHEYFGVDTETLWKTAKSHLPGLKLKIETFLKAQEK